MTHVMPNLVDHRSFVRKDLDPSEFSGPELLIQAAGELFERLPD